MKRSSGAGAILFAIVWFAMLLPVWAQQSGAGGGPLRMTIEGPGSQLSTIAVSGLKNLGGDDDHRTSSDFVNTLRRDLDLSGYFRNIDPHAFIEDPQTSGFELGQFNFADWRSINSDFVVKGSITQEDGGSIKLTAYLYDVAQQRRMMGKNYTGAPGDVRRIGRRFADAVLEASTGQKGPFDSKLGFVSTRGGRFKEIYTQSIDGEDLFKLTDNPTINLFPSFDRTTNSVLYLSYKSMEPSLYLADLKAQREIKLGSPHGRVIGGTISSDGTRVVAAIERNGATNLFLLAREGGELRQLTESNGINVSPAISPDGSMLAFTSDRSGTPQIWAMPLSGGSARRITFKGDYNTTPSYSPKGDRIVYQSRANGRFDIWTIAFAGGTPAQLTDGNGSNEYPSWSPDGRYIAFSSTRSGHSQIYIMMVSNRKIISTLTEGIGNDSCPAWSWWLGE